MCGIAGILSLGARLDEKDRCDVRRMTQILRHRGPDAIGFCDGEKYLLGNTRLKIIDLSERADLPMADSSGKILIAYNGEVTNFIELRRDYRLDDKYRFRPSSDTEVLLALYRELGIGFIDRLSGIFAFTLVDEEKGKSWVVRDFFGTRPLFTMEKNRRFYFASEIKS